MHSGHDIRDERGHMVAIVHNPKAEPAQGARIAALMAAAPDMLATLIDLMALIDSPQITIYGVVDQQWTVTKREARAAIARATGPTP
jgi:hypothetical protein